MADADDHVAMKGMETGMMMMMMMMVLMMTMRWRHDVDSDSWHDAAAADGQNCIYRAMPVVRTHVMLKAAMEML